MIRSRALTLQMIPTGLRQFIRTLLCVSLLSCNFLFLTSQENYYIKTYTTDNGLSHNSVLSIAQDKTGFLWIGTWDGLCRFDGYRFHNYFHDPGDSTTIPYFTVAYIKVDRDNQIWISSRSRTLTRYIRETDNFINYSRNIDPVLDEIGVDAIETDLEGYLWVAGAGGLARYDSITKHFRRVRIKDNSGYGITRLDVFNLQFDNAGGLWLICSGGIFQGRICVKDSTEFLQINSRYRNPTLDQPGNPMGLHYRFLFRIGNDSVPWLLSNTGGYRLDIKSGEFKEYSGRLPDIFTLHKDDLCWVKNGNSCRIIRGSIDHTEIPLSPGELPQEVFIDNTGSIWYGTITATGFGTGLHSYSKTPGYFKHYLGSSRNQTPVVVYSVYKDGQGDVWIGSQDHPYIDRIKPDGHTVRMNELSPRQAMFSRHPRAMLPDSEGVWIGYLQQRLDYYNIRSGKISQVYLNKNMIHDEENPWGFRSLCTDSKGNLLVGTLGVYVYLPEEKKFRMIWKDQDDLVVFCIKGDHEGNIWVGASKSLLMRFDSHYRLDTTIILSDHYYNPEDIAFGDNGEVWIALMGGGLCRYDQSTGKKEFYTTANGLSNNTIYSILKDQQGNLWLSTNNGISKFNPQTRQFRIFGPSDGLKIHEFNADAAYMAPDGEMFFGGMGGVVSYYPDSMVGGLALPEKFPLVITSFRVSGSPRYFRNDVNELVKLELEKGDNNFTIAFACLNFRDADKIKYRYRLIGLSPRWTESDHLHRNVNFAGLSPGIYQLELEATDSEGNWMNKRSLGIVIPPYYYETLWFRILVIALTAFIIAAIVMMYNRQIRLKEKQKQEYLRLESLRGQMNPHFVFNSLNSINFFISKSDRLSANRYIASFSTLIRSILDHMSQEYINLVDEMASVEDYLKLEFLRFGDKFDYHIDAVKYEDAQLWEVFPGMVQPFVENAIWHGVRSLEGRKGFIRIVFKFADTDHLQCIITDDGIGRDLSRKRRSVNPDRKSRGIAMVMERLGIINDLKKRNYQLLIEDLIPGKEECGTRVSIDLPVRKKCSSQ